MAIWTGDIPYPVLSSLEVYYDKASNSSSSSSSNSTSSKTSSCNLTVTPSYTTKATTLMTLMGVATNTTYNYTVGNVTQDFDRVTVPSGCDCRLTFLGDGYRRYQSDFVRGGSTLKLRNSTRPLIKVVNSYCIPTD